MSEIHDCTFIQTEFHGCTFDPDPPTILSLADLPEFGEFMDRRTVQYGGKVFRTAIHNGTFYGCLVKR